MEQFQISFWQIYYISVWVRFATVNVHYDYYIEVLFIECYNCGTILLLQKNGAMLFYIGNQVVRVPGSTPLLCPSTEACKCKDGCLPKGMIPKYPKYPKLISNYLDIDQTFGS